MFFLTKKEKKIVLFGTGNEAEKIIRQKRTEIAYFIDNNYLKHGKFFFEKIIFSPNQLRKEKKGTVIILISSSLYYLEMSNQLQNMGFHEGKDFFLWEEFWIKKYEEEMKKREKLDFFHFRELAEDMPVNPKEYGYNSFYGNDRMLRNYLKLDKDIKLNAVIEHGLYTRNSIEFIESVHDFPRIYTFSIYRKKILEKFIKNKEIVSIGPYIKYAKGFYSDDKIKLLKRKYGKVLLVFLCHSTHHLFAKFDSNLFLLEIEKVKKIGGYDTVFVNVYWKDIVDKKYEDFLFDHYVIVSAGHIYDSLFLDRLKNIIDLSDMTMSNSCGTHIGYCICQGKPHYYFNQKIEYEHDDDSSNRIENGSNEIRKNFCSEVNKIFGFYSEGILKEQTKFVEKYWGLNETNFK